ncbi:MAG: N-6 DNA methylase [Acidobacteria bacterium]|nr:N-6 DNA methylase [Acidobacteriota bacterium]
MISRSSLTRLGHSPTALFEMLELPVTPVEIDVDDWRRCGFDPSIRPPVRLIHAGSLGRVDLIALEGPGASLQAKALIESYFRWSRDLTPLVSVADGSHLSAWSISNSSVRRLDIDTRSPGSDLIARLNALRAHQRSGDRLAGQLRSAFAREDVSMVFLRSFRGGVANIEEITSSRLGVSRTEAARFALRLASRLLFLQFIQAEGWLDHDTSFLRNRIGAAIAKGRNAYRAVLIPLFFGALDRPAARRSARAAGLGSIPFLNGGLFRRTLLERRNTALTLPNEILSSLLEKVFDPFTYTIREDDSEGLSIDPEMLGHVFESLMSSNERAESGSFYTPRPVVDRLTRSALVQWLANGDTEQRQRIEANETEAFESRQMYRRLQRARVVDPACGSGAFLLSVMQTIERLSRELAGAAGFSPPRRLRRRIVARSLHGVDLKPEAVELCELRLWLAVAGSERNVPTHRIQPLPNLDRNIRQGNSLLSPLDLIGASRHRASSRWVKEVRRRRHLLDRYRAGGSGSRLISEKLHQFDRNITVAILRDLIAEDRELLRLLRAQSTLVGQPNETAHIAEAERRIRERTRQLRSTERGSVDAFSWEVHFGEAMQNGFDLVVGNPPWVRSSRVPPATRARLAEVYDGARGGTGGVRQFDLASLFVEAAIDRLAPDGVAAMLVPSKILKSNYGLPIRQRIEKNHSLLAVHDWSRDSSIFDADVFPVGLTVGKRASVAGPVRILRDSSTLEVSRERMSHRGRWLLLPPELLELIDSLGKRHRTLEEVLRRKPFMGIRTGGNAEHFLRVSRIGDRFLELEDGGQIPLDQAALCARGRDVRRWNCEPATFLRMTLDSRPRFVSPAHLGMKVVWKDVATRLECVALAPRRRIHGCSIPLVPNQTLYGLQTFSREESHYLSAMLNSAVCTFLAIALADQAKDGHYRFYGATVGQIPFPRLDPSSPLRKRLARLGAAAHAGGNHGKRIDEIAATAYGIRLVELSLIGEALEDGRHPGQSAQP